MPTLKSTKETSETKPLKYGCEFCNREFAKERTLLTHICETKHRWLEKDKQGCRIAYQSFVQFYAKHTASKKLKTQLEFIKSAYYIAFVKFGNYCVDINCINVSRYVDWLLRDQIKLDNWTSDSNYNKFLQEYLRIEDPFDAIKRSVEFCMSIAETEKVLHNDVLRYVNPNKVCYAVTTGKISPWVLYQSSSGIHFLETLNPDHAKMIMDYINPEQWALKFHRETENVKQVKELLNAGGY
jgi:hypothetical protein